MRLLSLLSLGSLIMPSALATNLYVSSYAGTITSLKLSQKIDGSFCLTQTGVNTGSSPSPSWLTKDEFNDVVYCSDEALDGGNGSLASYSTSPTGKLTQIDRQSVLNGAVSSVLFNGGKAQALAHYGGSALSTWTVLPSGGSEALQTFTFELTAPGTDPDRQDAPHPHEALIDPTDRFVVVPDLGADLVRVFSIDPETSILTESTPFSVVPGSGPRHGRFLATDSGVFFFLVTELGNTVTSYAVDYQEDTKPPQLSFRQIQTNSIYGPNPTPAGAAAAEAYLSPDEKYLLTSSRNDSLFEIDNFDPTNSTKIPSDTLQVWKIDHSTGELAFEQLAPAGGSFPRQFSLNKNGTLAAVGLQNDARMVIIERDVETGRFGKFVAHIDIPGQVTSVIWDD